MARAAGCMMRRLLALARLRGIGPSPRRITGDGRGSVSPRVLAV
jgi:hypothetical protein